MIKTVVQLNKLSFTAAKGKTTCGVFASELNPEVEKRLGKIFGIIEIESEEKENSKIINMIADEIEKFYYGKEINEEEIRNLEKRNASQLPLEGIENIESIFETALQKLNQKLTDLIKAEKISLLPENLNVVIGVIKNKSLYFTHIGKVNAFLLHKKKNGDYAMVNIMDSGGRDSDQLNLIRIFSNIINGNIASGDILLFTTPSLLDYFSMERLKTTLTTLTLPSAIHHLKTWLTDADPFLNVASIIIKLVAQREKPMNGDSEALPNLSTSQASMAELSLTHKKTKELLTPSLFMTVLKRSKSGLVLLTYRVKEAFSQIKEWDKTRKEAMKQRPAKKKPAKRNITAPEPLERPRETIANDQEFRGQILAGKTYIFKGAKNITSFAFIQIKRLKQNAVAGIKNKINNFPKPEALGIRPSSSEHILGSEKFKTKSKEFAERIKRIGYYAMLKYKRLPGTSKILLLITLALAALFIFSLIGLSLKQQHEVKVADFNKKIAEAQDKVNAAEASIIYNEEEKGRILLTEAEGILNNLETSSGSQKESKDNLINEINSILGKIRHMKIITNPILLADISQIDSTVKLADVIRSGSNLYAFNPNNNIIYRVDLADENKVDILEGVSPELGHLNMAVEKDKNSIFFYHSNNGIAELNTVNQTVQAKTITIAGDNPYIKAMAIFSNRLYLLDTNNNEIWKHEPALSGYARGNAWLRDNVNVHEGVSLAVDGSVYILKADGEVLKMIAGRNQPFNLANPDPTWNSPNKIFTGSNNKYLYIMDPGEKRILIYTKTGRLIMQYYSDEWSNLRGFAVNEANKQIYILSGQKIYGIIAEEL